MNILLEIKSASYKPPKNFSITGEKNEAILKNISLAIEKGSFTGIAGESGSGKTTLARIIAGIIKPTSGIITLNYSDGWDSSIRTNPVQILFQNNGEIINPFRKIIDTIKETLKIRNDGKADNPELPEEILKFVNLDKDTYTKKGYQLSGGQRQRIAMARLWAVKPQILILDEPVSAQDVESQANLSSLLSTITVSQNVSLIVISHNRKVLEKVSDRIIELSNGAIISNNF